MVKISDYSIWNDLSTIKTRPIIHQQGTMRNVFISSFECLNKLLIMKLLSSVLFLVLHDF